ncbi:unnamed protein product [Durusdinium trenchii]|uniref:RNA helicase n=1 Tax=Durusdinium trenchii TaxID=1381693 RepID=A0ABP0RWE6_9DINO
MESIVKTIMTAMQRSVRKDEMQLEDAVCLAHANNLTLVLDEAHTIFNLPDLCVLLFKSDTHPKLLLLSASGEGKGSRAVTPSEIKQKFFWTPPVPETEDALDELVKGLNEAGVHLDARSVAFFLKFCGGHRSIYVAAMRWVKQMQDETSHWAFRDTVAKVRASISDGSWATGTILGALAESRGVKVNGRYSDLDVVQKEFIQRLCEGPGNLSKEIRRELTIQGFVIPVSEGNDEFQRVDWTRPGATYAVANPILASYYRHQLQNFCGLKVHVEPFVPVNCLDLLLRAIPCLTFAQVVSFAADLESNSSLSGSDLPYEEQYNAAILHALQRLGYQASAPLTPRNGKVDVLVQINQMAFSLECIMANRGQESHIEHRNRFDNENLTNYFKADHKALVTIGSTNVARKRVNETRADGVEIVGLMPNIAHTGYHVLYRGLGPKTTEQIKRFACFQLRLCFLCSLRRIPNECVESFPYFVRKGAAEGTDLVEYYVECDLVARALDHDRIRCIQKISHINPPGKPPRLDQAFGTQTKAVWVRQLQQEIGNAFQVKGELLNVDDLKEEKLSIAASKIDIYSSKDGKWIWKKEEKMSACLRDISEENPYGYIVP